MFQHFYVLIVLLVL